MDAFAITQDTVLNFNQVTGKNLIAYFKDGKIHQINVKGNARTLYFPIDEKKNNQLIGMNRADCSSIVVRFENGQFTSVTYQKKPDAKMTPPKDIKEVEKTLDGFEWRSELRPLFKTFSELRPPVAIPVIPGKELLLLENTSPVAPTKDSTDIKVEAKADTTEAQVEKKAKKEKAETKEPKTEHRDKDVKTDIQTDKKKSKKERSEKRSK